MSITPPAPPNAPVETKVKAATAAAGGTALFVTAIVAALLQNTTLAAGVKTVIIAAVPAVLTAAATFYAGWKARHTSRSALNVAPAPIVSPPPVA
jgi:hypothetical protein